MFRNRFAMELKYDSFQQLVEQASDTVMLLDADGIVVYANAATAELFGRQPEELLGESFGHVITAEQPTEIQIPHPWGGAVTADIRSTRVKLAGRSFNAVYLRDVTERKLNELALLETSRRLRERVKEQTCVRRVTEILLQSHTSLDEALQGVVDLLPPAWQYPDVTAARITLDSRVYTSEGFRESEWRQREPVTGGGTDDGAVEIFYAEECPEADDGPFLREERELLSLVAIKIGQALDRRQSEKDLLRTNRALRVLSTGSSELIHAETEPGLLEAICRVCVDQGGYRMAWVGFAEHDKAKSVRPVARAGFEDGYLERTSMTWKGNDHGEGPTGRAIRTGEPQVSHNFVTDSSMAPWRDEAIKRGYRSSVALPLKHASGTFGMLAIYSDESDAFDATELRLLKELAEDLAFGIVTLRDRAQYKIAKERVEHLAYFDELTGLANRNQLMEALDQTTARLRSGQQCALLTLNVARFGDIQAGIGVRQADELLSQVACRIREALGPGELPARLGGDEFAILVSNGSVDHARSCAQRVEQALDSPFQQAGIPISIQMRIGTALAPEHGNDPEVLLLRSGMAVRHAKRSGTMFEVYGGSTESESPRHLALITELRAAIEANQFLLDYQPRVDITTGTIAGVEALVRWLHPEQGVLPPARFIGIAEQTGLINPLTYLVLDAALLQCVRWREAGFEMPVAVNISANIFTDADFVDRVREMLQHRHIPPEYLQLEITESTLMEEPAKAHDVLDQLQRTGIEIFIDDFGTGYSSLNYVANLPIHALKIDRAFVIRMLESPRTRSVVETTISLARSLGIRAVAEGVDAKEQAEALMAMGCTEIQGFYFSRPVDAQTLQRWVEGFSLASYALHPAPD